MPRIQVLPDLLVNKIAAGEVIERPASVVKELVENSLDAGATRIEVHVEDGGRRLIRVVDDGCGMDAEDLALAIRPHATSKIAREDDLFGIRTLGFRGEALPSIGAVSQLRVVSRRREADQGHEIAVAGDRVEPLRAAAAPPGTTVEVRQLFFNVPARQKFLRTPQTEMGQITEQLARIALVQPRVEFRLTHNARPVHHLKPVEGMRPRIADFYGAELAGTLLEIRRQERGLSLAGWVSRPADSRSTAKWQYLFLNGRFIRDRFIIHAVREAYRGLMESSRYPVVFLALEIDPAEVDVNVHPTKIEVRWRDSNAVYSQVLSALRDRFLRADLTPALRPDRGFDKTYSRDASDLEGPIEEPTAAGASGGVPGEDPAAERRREEIRRSIAEFFKTAQPIVGPSGGYDPGGHEAGSGRLAEALAYTPRLAGADDDDAAAAPEPAGGLAPLSLERMPLEDAPASSGDDEPDEAFQIHRAYLVAETPDGLVIVDQHALHERILFEQLAAALSRGPLESQRLLIPDLIDVSPDQVAVIELHAEVLARLGFELTAYGPGTIAVHAAPSLLREGRAREFVRDLLDRLSTRSGPASAEMLTNDLLSMMACKAAVKAGDALSDQEIRALMRQRRRVERSSNCPHGRPTSLRLTIRELERQFKRT
ncbi:MAG: DNA mismatch repair endonuclease MutL [Phycisphaerae bacterium]|jgi:DNA mismatch repair protein MutL